jgi:hypothetical protein
MFRQKEKCIFGASLYTAWISIAKIAFKRRFDFLVKKDSAKRTGGHTLLAGDTLLTVNIIDTVLGCDGSSRTILHALGNLALSTDDGHSYDRVRVDDHHPNGALLGVVYPETIDGANQLANLTSRASLSYDGQLPSHVILLKFLCVPLCERVNNLPSLNKGRPGGI